MESPAVADPLPRPLAVHSREAPSARPRRGLAVDELEEGAAFSAGLLLLVQQGEPLRVELLEPLVPADLLEGLVAGAAGEVEAQDVGVVAGAADAGGLAAIALDPLTDLVVVGRGGGLGCHVGHSL